MDEAGKLNFIYMSTTKNTFGVTFNLKKQKASSSGLMPIYARITINGRRLEIALKHSIEESSWNNSKGIARGSREEILKLNRYLDRYKARVIDIYQELTLSKTLITPELIKDKLTNADKEEYTLCKLMDYHNEQQGSVLRWGTMKNYITTQSYIRSFLTEKYKTPDRYLHELTYQFITNFDLYLRRLKNNAGQPSMSNNGVMKHLERLRKMINLAIKLDWIEKNPFTAHRLKFEKIERDFLTAEELSRVEKKALSIYRLKQVRDLFVFSCYTGLSYADVIGLTESHIVTGVDKNLWLNTRRTKTDVTVKVPLLPQAMEILDYYKQDPVSRSDGKLLPSLSNQKLNSYLKEIADICGISKRITFHTARHTFATTVTLSNGVPIESVSKMLGHTKLATTQIYAKVVETKISEDMSKLKRRLKRK
jgi:integrase